ncbi:uncharacterized protein TRUGW13939_04725 [Talaromyces rugulosus]|uniref:t-SNARE coiled-coil homology domain-containing protein n=1 Tax=Talaromyces rugulosus TaxID=121627 RepID=A0A7H8QUG3_TALRU|nr:uncharacterized protein TRUGW13939_04725 [Talaromyces rugulosus]QKX57607.1 hypothetical protein TRUGW13939_04725 [Talaromyces rugulosus]
MTDYYRNVDLEQGHTYELQYTSSNPTAILNKCRDINTEIAKLRQKRERQLHAAQQAVLDSTNSATDQQTRRKLDNVESEITAALRQTRDMVADLKHKLRSNPDGSAAVHTQVGLLGRNLQEEVKQMRKSQMVFDRTLREQVRRRYEIANPDATAEEIDSGVEGVISGQTQAFQIQGARRQEASDAQAAVANRSVAIRKIEQDLIELSHLSQEVAILVQQQEPLVDDINKNAQDTAENTAKANDHLVKAIFSARNARKYKWYILFVCLLILAIVIAVPIAWCEINHACGAK